MNFRRKMISAALLAIISAAAPAENRFAEAASLYKRYIVHKEGDSEILCDSYIVQPGDYVSKLMKRKGEIAEKDFPEFLDIFRRINLHVPNIDLILPGQHIHIPLKKLRKDSLPGQETGTVVLPLITISSFREKIGSQASEYVIQTGDSISALISARFGALGTAAFSRGMRLIELLNPDISDLNRVYPGQRIRVPNPSLRDESWFAPLFEETGKLILAAPPAPARPTAEKKIPENSFGIFSSLLGARLFNRGVYYFPTHSGSGGEIDLSRIPILALADGTRVLLASDGSIPESDLEAIRKYWKKLKIVRASEETPLDELLDQILYEHTTGPVERRIVLNDEGIEIKITTRWIFDVPPAGPGKKENRVCLTPIRTPDERTPESIRVYLENHGILVQEILPSFKPVGPPSEKRQAIIEKQAVYSRENQKELVQRLALELGLYFSENVRVTFPYAGIQVEAFSNLLSTKGGDRLLVDFGEIYGEAASAIEKTGIRLLHIAPEKDAFSLVRDVLAALGLFYSEKPTFLAAKRPPLYNIAVTFPGILIQDKEMRPKVLLTGSHLPDEIARFIRGEGVKVILVRDG